MLEYMSRQQNDKKHLLIARSKSIVTDNKNITCRAWLLELFL